MLYYEQMELKDLVKRRSKQEQYFLEIQIVPIIYLNFALKAGYH